MVIQRVEAKILSLTFPCSRLIGLFAVALAIFFAADPLHGQDVFERKGFSINIKQPESGAFLFGKIKIKAEVQIDDESRLDRVEFYVGDKLIFVDRDMPFQTFYDFGTESKSWVIRAIAYHKEEISVSDFVITRQLDVHYTELVNRVILTTTVVDKKGRRIKDLTRDDFTIYEDGIPQELIDFYMEKRPIFMALLIDTSGSMKEDMKEVQKAAVNFVKTLTDKDQALVIDFDERVFLIQDFTHDQSRLEEAINSTISIGGTAIYDALHASFRILNKVDGRKAIILLSDGEDTESFVPYEEIIQEVKASDVTIYSIGLGAASKSVLKELAEETGGAEFFPSSASKLETVYGEIADELRTQYYITYATQNKDWDGRWIKINVEMNNKEYKVRTKKGFFAVKKPFFTGEE
jgi:VWFA-related protein